MYSVTKKRPSTVRLTGRVEELEARQLLAAWNLAWSDEFNGTALNTSVWSYETGYIRNQELQYYTNRTENVRVQNGNLVIEARKEPYQGYQYTSGSIMTKGKVSHKYGRIEVRAKLPYGQGMWPAFWMMGNKGNWPACGEMDIVEMIGGGEGRDDKAYGSMHWKDASGNHAMAQSSTQLPYGNFADDYHLFGIDWNAQGVTWYVDGKNYGTQSTTASDRSEFQQAFYYMFSLAVGGFWPGSPNASTVFPQQCLIDYIRVYQLNSTATNTAPVATNQSVQTPVATSKDIALTYSDANNDHLVYTTLTAPAHGTLEGFGPNVRYTPVAGYSGPDSFTYKVNDGFVDSGTATVSITVGDPNAAPAAPSGLAGTTMSSVQINLAWTDNANDETGFTIERATDALFTQNRVSAAVGANITGSQQTGLSAGTTYYFRVKATKTGAPDSIYGATASATTQVLTPTAPTTPTSLSAATVSASQVNLAWTDNATDETGYTIEWATDAAFMQNFASATASVNASSFQVTNLSAAATYYFRVKANKTGAPDSAYSNTASASTAASLTITFEGLGATGNIYAGNNLAGSSAGTWCTAVQGYQFKISDQPVGLAISDGSAGIGRMNWGATAIQMKKSDDGSFTMGSFKFLRNASWTGQDYTWTVTGYDATSGGNVRFTQTFSTSVTPATATLSAANSAIAVKRIEWTGWSANPQSGNNGPSLLDDIVVAPAAALTSSGGTATMILPLSQAAINRTASEALLRWSRAGADVSSLRGVRFVVADLGSNLLASYSGGVITLDDDAAGYGWYVDKNLKTDSEFRNPRKPVKGMDLLSAISHEYGHALGLGHRATGVMDDTLATGVRNKPVRADVFSRQPLAAATAWSPLAELNDLLK